MANLGSLRKLAWLLHFGAHVAPSWLFLFRIRRNGTARLDGTIPQVDLTAV